jgi:hypothetical protein
MSARAPRLVLPVLAALVVTGCPEDTLGTTPPAAVDVSGTWTGSWSEDVDENPLTGTMFLTLLQGAGGQVEGTIALGNISCLGSHAFTGTVTGITLDGLIEEEGLRVTFLVDLDNVEGEFPDLTGTFLIEEGADCSVTEAMFDVDLQIGPPEPPEPPPDPGAPATDDGGAGASWTQRATSAATVEHPTRDQELLSAPYCALAPYAELGGAWRGALQADAGAPRPLELTLLQAPDGTLRGLLGRDAEPPRAFLGALRGPWLVGVAEELELEAQVAVDPLTGATRLAGLLRGEDREASETASPDAVPFELSRAAVDPAAPPR